MRHQVQQACIGLPGSTRPQWTMAWTLTGRQVQPMPHAVVVLLCKADVRAVTEALSLVLA